MPDDTYRRLFDILAAGQWDGVGPKPTLAARIDAQKAYDALQLLDPDALRPRRGWRTLVWGLLATMDHKRTPSRTAQDHSHGADLRL